MTDEPFAPDDLPEEHRKAFRQAMRAAASSPPPAPLTRRQAWRASGPLPLRWRLLAFLRPSGFNTGSTTIDVPIVEDRPAP